MRKYENLYAGIGGKRLVGGVDLDKVKRHFRCLSQLDICAENGVVVGFISLDALLLAFDERKDRLSDETIV